jgi:hypothetical protein
MYLVALGVNLVVVSAVCYLLFHSKTTNHDGTLEFEWQTNLGSHPPSHFVLGFQDDLVMPKATPNSKRKRETASEDRPGQSTKRPKTDITNWTTPRYDWLASIQSASEIGLEHVLALCGLGPLGNTPLCPNKLEEGTHAKGDVIDVSDSEDGTIHSCSKVKCKNNPYCLNYLGQEKWENEGKSDTGIPNAI